MIKFAYTIFYVKDVEKTIAFYEKVFDLQRRFVSPDNDYGELQTGATTLSFASNTLAESNLNEGYAPANPSAKPFGMEIGFATDDVDALVKKAVENGATLYEAAKEKPWGQTVAYVRDLDGFLIEICTEMQ
ncbi:VOC family protein [Nostoc ellipsosporum NOK]|jgi:lactoylglutathione lyase|nr:VOC family protein [Nostoc ellipsosporum NOK]